MALDIVYSGRSTGCAFTVPTADNLQMLLTLLAMILLFWKYAISTSLLIQIQEPRQVDGVPQYVIDYGMVTPRFRRTTTYIFSTSGMARCWGSLLPF